MAKLSGAERQQLTKNYTENAEAYQRETFAEVQKLLSKAIEGNPQVRTYEVPYTSLTKAARGTGGA